MRRVVALFLTVFLTSSIPVSFKADSCISATSLLRELQGVEGGLEEQISLNLKSGAADPLTTGTLFPSAPAQPRLAGLEERLDAAEAERVFDNLRRFSTDGEFNADNSTVSIISHGRVNRVYLIERRDGVKLIGFQLNAVWNFPALDRNHLRFEAKQQEAFGRGMLPTDWKPLHFLDRVGERSKLYQENGAHWRFMEFTEGRVIQSIDEIPADKRLVAVERFGHLLVQFRQMLELPAGGEFENSLPNFQETAYHLKHYDRVLAGEEVQVSLSSDPNQLTRLDPSRPRSSAFENTVAQFREEVESLLKGLKRVPTHGDPKVNNVFWEINGLGEWVPLSMGDLDTLQLGHETLDIADAARVLAFEGGENADPNRLVVLPRVVESLVQGWLTAIDSAYGATERERLESLVYPSIAAIYFTLALRFYDSYVTGDSYFEAPARYGKTVSDPEKYLQAAEVQRAQFMKFIDAFHDKPGMQRFAQIAQAGMEDRAPATISLATPAPGIQTPHAGLLGGSFEPKGTVPGPDGDTTVWKPRTGTDLGDIEVWVGPKGEVTTRVNGATPADRMVLGSLNDQVMGTFGMPWSGVHRNSMHVFDPDVAPAGVVFARMIMDPVAVIARDQAQAADLEAAGFHGEIVLLTEFKGDLKAARRAAMRRIEYRYPGQWTLVLHDVSVAIDQMIAQMLSHYRLDQEIAVEAVRRAIEFVAQMRSA